MPNPVVSFEINGPDPEALRTFYADVFDWEVFSLPGGYALIDTSGHEHGEDDSTVYTGEDAYRNDGVVIGSQYAQPAWRFTNETSWRAFEPGIGGGIGGDRTGVSVYIQVPDLAAALARVAEHGGSVAQEPTEVAPNVTIAAFNDPAGNRIGLILARS